MALAGAIRDWAQRSAPTQGAPRSITELAEHYGRQQPVTPRNRRLSLVSRGSGALAKDLGVDIRSVQRYMKGERNQGGEVRIPEQQTRSRLARIRERVSSDYQRNPVRNLKQLADRIRRGLRVQEIHGEVCVSDDCRQRIVRPGGLGSIPVSVRLDDFASHVQLGRWNEAAAEFEAAFFDAYNLPTGHFGGHEDEDDAGHANVDWLDMEAGA